MKKLKYIKYIKRKFFSRSRIHTANQQCIASLSSGTLFGCGVPTISCIYIAMVMSDSKTLEG